MSKLSRKKRQKILQALAQQRKRQIIQTAEASINKTNPAIETDGAQTASQSFPVDTKDFRRILFATLVVLAALLITYCLQIKTAYTGEFSQWLRGVLHF